MAELKTHTMKSAPKTTLNADIFTLDQIPAAMDKMGWVVAAQLMRHWFNGKPAKPFTDKTKTLYVTGPAINIPPEHVNDSIVKMQWAMKFEPVQKAIKKLKEKWRSERGLIELKKRLIQNKGKLEKLNDVKMIDTYLCVNRTTIGEADYDPFGSYSFSGISGASGSGYSYYSYYGSGMSINDFMGAIGLSTLKIVPCGYQTVRDGKNVFITEKIGFYIKDTYDFLGRQFLGVWNKNEMLGAAKAKEYLNLFESKSWKRIYDLAMQNYAMVWNSDFRKWQQVKNTGIDFVVFSDVYWDDPLDNHRVTQLDAIK
ncbi:DUF6402 family protein [Snodgrassella alvi]|uniref:DUF6402 family protein n=1 Tax=Snodgrassella alvi TaxID=1196083 RepID=UPI000A046F68|nr:DUF6402 family protein [Snodgrassella alvi]ORF27798.1 hypothetical protein BGI08_07740 [Snodgrassella alvi]